MERIVIFEYDPLCAQEANNLPNLLGSELLSLIEHIGSTAIARSPTIN